MGAASATRKVAKVAPDVDAYIAAAPPEAKAMLKERRRLVRDAAPEAQQCIS